MRCAATGRAAWRCSIAGCRAAAIRGVRSRWCAATTPTTSPPDWRWRAPTRSSTGPTRSAWPTSGYVGCGYLLTVPERLEAACRGNVERLQELGLDTRFLKPDEIGEVEPQLSLQGIAGAAYEPDGGFADAQKMCLGWFAAASANGLEHQLGKRCDGDPGRGRAGDGPRDRPRVLPPRERSCWPPARGRTTSCARSDADQPIELRRLQVAVAAANRAQPLPSAVCSDAVTNVVVRPDRGRRFCAVAYAGEDLLERADDCDHAASAGYETSCAGRWASATRVSRGSRCVRGLAGPYDITPDWNPIIGPCPGIDGLYLALGWSGHGFKLSPAVGEVVAAEVTGRTPPIDVTSCAPSGSPRAGCCGWPTGQARGRRPQHSEDRQPPVHDRRDGDPAAACRDRELLREVVEVVRRGDLDER